METRSSGKNGSCCCAASERVNDSKTRGEVPHLSWLLSPPPPLPLQRNAAAISRHPNVSLPGHRASLPADMERAGGAGEAGDAAPVAAGGAGGGVVKGRSCKGCLFYSSVLRSRARGPVCVGVTRAIPQVPDRMVGEIELEAIQEGRNLSDFKYACVGYSIYLDDKENYTGKGDKQAQLPICVGVELLADRRASTKQAPGHLKKEGPQPRQYKHGPGGEDFLTKFQRNAGLVANGVARNLNKVGTYIKDTVGDIMFPYRKPPK